MTNSIDVQRILATQPLLRMRQFAELLGWRGLRLGYVLLRDDEATPANAHGGVVIFYQTTDEKFNLQINTYPHGQCRQHQANVKADRYGILHVGWHEFELFHDHDRFCQEAERLRPWLDRQMFRNPIRRRQYLREHPETEIR